MDFYDNIAGIYDEMTRFDSRIEKEKPVFKSLLKNYPASIAIDAACGSGLHTIVLNQLGVKTIGIDISQEMITLAEQNALKYKVKTEFLRQAMDKMSLSHTVDALFCLGNSLPHLDENALGETLNRFYKTVHPGGYVLIQLINFAKLLHDHERILAVHESGNKTFVRFYDYMDSYLQFNILIIEKTQTGLVHSINSTKLYPYTFDRLKAELEKAGFQKNELYGSLQLTPFDPESCKDLVIISHLS